MKKKDVKGFTLAELLIVIAIMAVLVAIAFPVFSSQLESARHSVDDANRRAAMSLAEAHFLSEHADDGKEITLHFCEKDGNLYISNCSGECSVKDSSGDGTELKSKCHCPVGTESVAGENKSLTVKVSADGIVSAKWE